jgi:hypothetical protein
MKAKLLLLCCLSAMTARAGDPLTQQFQSSHITTLQPMPLSETLRLQSFMTPRHDRSVITIGRSDFALNGPFFEGLRPLPPDDNLSRGQQFLRLPVIRLLVPRPEPTPSRTSRYFAWRNCPDAWTVAASRPEITRDWRQNRW